MTLERYSGKRPAGAVGGTTFNDFVLPVDVSYQVNAWGRISKNVESYREQAQASGADLAVVNLTMHADLKLATAMNDNYILEENHEQERSQCNASWNSHSR